MKKYGIMLIKDVESAFPGDVHPGVRFYEDKMQRDNAAFVLYHSNEYSRDNDTMVAIDIDNTSGSIETYSFPDKSLVP